MTDFDHFTNGRDNLASADAALHTLRYKPQGETQPKGVAKYNTYFPVLILFAIASASSWHTGNPHVAFLGISGAALSCLWIYLADTAFLQGFDTAREYLDTARQDFNKVQSDKLKGDHNNV